MREIKKYVFNRKPRINLLFGAMICITILAVHYRYYNKYPSIELISKEEVVASLKTDIDLLNKVKAELLKIEGESINIDSRGKDGYWKYRNEPIREVFQKYDLHYILLTRWDTLKIIARIDRYRSGVTYWGIRYSEDGNPEPYYVSEEYVLEKKGDGYGQIVPTQYSYYTELIGEGWYYYETLFYR